MMTLEFLTKNIMKTKVGDKIRVCVNCYSSGSMAGLGYAVLIVEAILGNSVTVQNDYGKNIVIDSWVRV